MMNAVELPTLWLDWCHVTRSPATDLSDAAIEKFIKQARPNARILRQLKSACSTTPATSLWNRATATQSSSTTPSRRPYSLAAVLQFGHALLYPDSSIASLGWATALQLRRLMAIAVIVAPADQGGFSCNRPQIATLTVADVHNRLAALPQAATEPSRHCPPCAIWSWLMVLGVGWNWGTASVRNHAIRSELDAPGEHLCLEQPDLARQLPDATPVMPAIDRWGHLSYTQPLHPSSISVLVTALALLLQQGASTLTSSTPPASIIPTMFEDEEQALLHAQTTFDRADELNRQVTALLELFAD